MVGISTCEKSGNTTQKEQETITTTYGAIKIKQGKITGFFVHCCWGKSVVRLYRHHLSTTPCHPCHDRTKSKNEMDDAIT